MKHLQLRAFEVEVMNYLRCGDTIDQVAARLNISRRIVKVATQQLTQLGAISHNFSTRLHDVHHDFTYEILPDDEIRALRSPGAGRPAAPKKTCGVAWDSEIKFYIKHHMEEGITRTELARRLQISKQALCEMMVEMGLA